MEFKGTGVAVVTPFDKNQQIDIKALRKVINHIIENKVEFLVLLGTTGESVTLTTTEKKLIIETALEENNSRIPVIAGFGGNNTMAIAEDLKSYNLKGISGILSVSPYYNKPTQTGIFEHYKAISEQTDLPIIIYNIPGRTSSNLTVETTLKIASELKNVKAIKEASGNIDQMMKIIAQKPANFSVLSGDDSLTLPGISFGMDGVITTIGNAFPFEFSEMVRLALNGDFTNARKLHYKLLPLINLCFIESSPSGVKTLMKTMGLCESFVRLPLVTLNSTNTELMQTEYEKFLK